MHLGHTVCYQCCHQIQEQFVTLVSYSSNCFGYLFVFLNGHKCQIKLDFSLCIKTQLWFDLDVQTEISSCFSAPL